MNKYKKAKDVSGYLLIYPNSKGTEVVFRIYEKNKNGDIKVDKLGKLKFKDYVIRHHDLKIKLLEGEFWETDKGNFLDYPHKYLQKKKVDTKISLHEINDNKKKRSK